MGWFLSAPLTGNNGPTMCLRLLCGNVRQIRTWNLRLQGTEHTAKPLCLITSRGAMQSRKSVKLKFKIHIMAPSKNQTLLTLSMAAAMHTYMYIFYNIQLCFIFKF